MHGIKITACATLLAVISTGCFTGIESTPRITAGDVRNAGVRTTPEQAFLADLLPEKPTEWKKGKLWRADDDKISIIFTPASRNTSSLAGHILKLEEVRPVTAVTGGDEAEIVLTSDRGDSLFYRPSIKMREFAERSEIEIPFAVELDLAEKADSLMRGNTYYINTSTWYSPETASTTNGLRHVPVKITRVVPGTANYPLRAEFTSPNGKSGTYFVYLTSGKGTKATRNFDVIFSFSDPRQRYPKITDETWARIIRSQVVPGMTRDECRLALGVPNEINHGATQAAQLERWRYDNGRYLVFEDDILVSFRQ